MFDRQGNGPVRRRYRATRETGTAHRFASHANTGKGPRGGGQARGTLALVQAQRKVDCGNDAGIEGTTLAGNTPGTAALASPLRPRRWLFQASLPSDLTS